MFQSARKKMPAIDYVSIVRSVYKDRAAMLMGTVATAAAASAAGIRSGAFILFVHALIFLVLALVRYRESVAFERARIGAEDAETAEVWEVRAMVSGGLVAINYGMWCFSSLVLVDDSFAELASVSVTIAATVGIAARNFGLDRLVTLQALLLGVPMCTGLMLEGDLYHVFLALLFAPTLLSFRAVAGDVRKVLLAAVHDRVKATRLAAELDTAVTTMSHGLCLLDADLRVAVANPRASQMLLGRTDGFVGQGFLEVIWRAERNGLLTKLSAERLQTALAVREHCKLVLQLSDGTKSEVSITSSGDQIALVFEDITSRVETENRIKYMARYDDLTGLPNRRHFGEQLAGRLDKMRRDGGAEQVVLMMIDFDDFKHINDSLGHPVGDAVLKIVAGRIRQCLDSHVLVGRFGGDEYIVFDDRHVSRQRSEATAARLLTTLRQPLEVNGEVIEIHSSIGYVLASGRESDFDSLLKRADLALYAAKTAGKNQWAQFHGRMDKEYSDRQLLKAALRDALRQNQLSLAYQPAVDVRTRKIVGCEALARWHHPEFGTIPPSIFVPIAEEIGAISELTEWVLNTATKECATWPGDIRVAVNVSARDFRGDAVQRMVSGALVKSGLPARQLEIEVTETVFMQELDTAAKALEELRALGVGIALDDFGTGYSSLAYVHDMPFSKLKIDRTFALNVPDDQRALKLLKNIAQMSKELDMVVTVEGIETDRQLSAISQLGLIDQVQGFLFGVPVPQGEIGELLRTTSGERLMDQSQSA